MVSKVFARRPSRPFGSTSLCFGISEPNGIDDPHDKQHAEDRVKNDLIHERSTVTYSGKIQDRKVGRGLDTSRLER